MRLSILLLASGRGTRLRSEVPKAFVAVRGVPLVLRSARRLAQIADDFELLLAVHPEDRERHLAPVLGELDRAGLTAIVDGGETRQDSMRRALRASDPARELVVVHDAARPFFPLPQARLCCARALEVGAALLAIPAPDTLKLVDHGKVDRTFDRSRVWLAQTPQVIRRDRLLAALAHADATGFAGTDDVSLCEHAAQPVAVVEGDRRNLKITTPEDLVLAEGIATAEDGAR
ncbi:MAG: 2-C-methyl-D-erythritol 4-phosphate cytidylyltransferase [Planctomycetota bacterium]